MKAAVPALVLLAAVPAFAAQSTDIEIKPGPTSMSAAEKAIVADPAQGVEHGVILIDETERDDNRGTVSQIGRHVRAKILSAEGRGLADIVIPYEQHNTELRTWWGRTILPDGTVLELREEDLHKQSVAKSKTMDYRQLRGALLGVVPGCVIDYGYVLVQDGFSGFTRVFLQQEWPVRSFRYRWVPSQFMPAAYVMSRAEGLAVGAKNDRGSVLVSGASLQTVPSEPRMPPDEEARASVTFYYTTRDKAAEFWDTGAKRAEANLKSFVGNGAPLRDVLASLGIEESTPLEGKLKAAYEWLGANVKNTMLKSAEEVEAVDNDPEDLGRSLKAVLASRLASPRQLDYMFAGMARLLGAEAFVVFAVDRTEQFWNKSLKSFDQFGYTFVGVRARGASDDQLVFVDAGSALPYGQVPWRATGAAALMCTSKGSTSVVIPPTSPTLNRADTHVKLAFSEDNETMLGKWSRTAGGASGFEDRRWMRYLDPRERAETLDELCGASGRTEVVAAELPQLDETSSPFQLACDIEMSDTNLQEATSRYGLSIMGPWWPDTPEFTAGKRVHPVIFDYPKLDILAIDIEAPHGFKPNEPPPSVKLDSPYGRYHLVVTRTATGFHVDRAFALTVLIAKPPEYDALKAYFAEVRKADQTVVAFERD